MTRRTDWLDRPWLRLTVAVLILTATARCTAGTALDRARLVPTMPTHVERPLDAVLADFRRMLLVYTPEICAEDLIVEIEPIRNGAIKDLLPDLTPLVRRAVDKVGGPFRTVRTMVALESGAFVRARPDGRPTAYRITGSVIEAVDLRVKGRNVRADAMSSDPTMDGGVQNGGRQTTTTIGLLLTLETASGETVPGATATYQVTIQRLERDRTFSLYVAGNGFSWGNEVAIYEDPAAAVQDALTVTVTHLFGNAFLIPYWRVGAPFVPDQRLMDRFDSTLRRKTQTELEAQVKGYLARAGWVMDGSAAAFTTADRILVTNAMRQRSIDTMAPTALLTLASSLWSSLDYRTAAPAVQASIDEAIRQARIAATAETTTAASAAAPEWHLSPREFDWHSSASIVVVDLSRVGDPQTQRRITEIVGRLATAAEVRRHPLKALLGVRDIANAAQIQSVLRLSGLALEYLWLKDSRGQEYLVLRSSA